MLAALYPFSLIPDDYIVIDLETTGLPNPGSPGIVSIGITEVSDRVIVSSNEYLVVPDREIEPQAVAVHGITMEMAAKHSRLCTIWEQIWAKIDGRVVIAHNLSFDWPILGDNAVRHGLPIPAPHGLLCSQKLAIPWAKMAGLPCSDRGPSLDTLTHYLWIRDLRKENGGRHGAAGDTMQTALVIESLRTTYLLSLEVAVDE